MNVEAVVRGWLDDGDGDWRAAEALLEAQDPSRAAFFLHLTVEKALKAAVVRHTGNHAPFIHDLVRLAEAGGLELDSDRRELFEILNELHIESRYPRHFGQTRERIGMEAVKPLMKQVEEIRRWLQALLT